MANSAFDRNFALPFTPDFLERFNRATHISNKCKMAGYFGAPGAPFGQAAGFDQPASFDGPGGFGQQPPAFAPMVGAMGMGQSPPGHARLIWLKFFPESMVSRDGQGQFFHPWGRSAVTEHDLVARGQALRNELLACHVREEHKFESSGPKVAIDLTHDIVVLDNYNRMCVETFGRQPKDPAAEDFGQVADFGRFLLSVDQMLEVVARSPNLDKTNYRPFWGSLGSGGRAQRPTVFLLMDNWNPKWVQNQGKAEWASDLLVVNGVWDLSAAYQQKAQEIGPLLQLVEGRIDVEYCHWRTLHN